MEFVAASSAATPLSTTTPFIGHSVLNKIPLPILFLFNSDLLLTLCHHDAVVDITIQVNNFTLPVNTLKSL